MNKKSEMLPLGFIDVLVVGLMLFAGLFIFIGYSSAKESKIETAINERSSLVWDSDSMLVFLRQPKLFDFNSDRRAENGTIADLIAYSYEKNDYSELSKELHTFFDPRFPGFYEGWLFVVYSLGEGKIVKQAASKDFGTCLSKRKPVADVLIPTSSQGNPLRLVLFWDTGKKVCP